MLSDVRAVAFDLDNTLWDVEPVLARAEALLGAWLHRNCPRIAQGVSSEDMRRARAELAQREPHNAHDVTYLRLASLEAHALEYGYDTSVAAEAFGVFLAARNEVELYPDVRPALARLSARYRLASLSNGNADLHSIGLKRLFAVSLNARQIGAAKPEPRCFERLAAELGVMLHEILYVGDDPLLDVVASRAAGCACAWMNRGARAWPKQLPAPDLTVADCAELAGRMGT